MNDIPHITKYLNTTLPLPDKMEIAGVEHTLNDEFFRQISGFKSSWMMVLIVELLGVVRIQIDQSVYPYLTDLIEDIQSAIWLLYYSKSANSKTSASIRLLLEKLVEAATAASAEYVPARSVVSVFDVELSEGKVDVPPPQADDYVSLFLQPRSSGALFMYNFAGRQITLGELIRLKRSGVKMKSLAISKLESMSFSSFVFKHYDPLVPPSDGESKLKFKTASRMIKALATDGLMFPNENISVQPKLVTAPFHYLEVVVNDALEYEFGSVKVEAEIPAFWDLEDKNYSYAPRYRVYEHSRGPITLASYLDNYNNNVGNVGNVYVHDELMDAVNNNFLGSTGLEGQLGRLRASLKVHKKSSLLKPYARLAASKILQSHVIKNPDDAKFTKIISNYVYTKSDKSGYFNDTLVIVEMHKVLSAIVPLGVRKLLYSTYSAYKQARKNHFSVLPYSLAGLTLVQANYHYSKDAIGFAHREKYPEYLKDLKFDIDKHGFTWFSLTGTSSGGFLYKGRHRDIALSEYSAATTLMAVLSWEQKVIGGTIHFVKGDKQVSTQALEFLNLVKCVNKMEVTSAAKAGIKERNIFAPQVFADIGWLGVVKMFYKSLGPLEERIPDLSCTTPLYPFSQSGGIVYKIRSYVNKCIMDFLERRMLTPNFTSVILPVKLLYSDNGYLLMIRIYKDTEDTPLEEAEYQSMWMSLDGSSMEASITPMMFIFEALAMIEQSFGYKIPIDFATQILSTSSNYFVGKTGDIGFGEIPLARKEKKDPSRRSVLRHKKRIDAYWINYLLYRAVGYGKATAVLGNTQFIVPGMASGSPLTFHMNTMKMTTVADFLGTTTALQEMPFDHRVDEKEYWSDPYTYMGVPLTFEDLVVQETGVKLKGELCAPGGHHPFLDETFLKEAIRSTRTEPHFKKFIFDAVDEPYTRLKESYIEDNNIEIIEPPLGVYAVDLLGFDVIHLKLLDNLYEWIPILARDRLVKSIVFAKSESKQLIKSLMEEQKDDVVDDYGDDDSLHRRTALYVRDLLDLVRFRTLYLAGGWAYKGLDVLLVSLAQASRESLGKLPDSAFYYELLADSLSGILDPSRSEDGDFHRNSGALSQLLNPVNLKNSLNRSPVPSLAEVIRVMSRKDTAVAFFDSFGESDIIEEKIESVFELVGELPEIDSEQEETRGDALFKGLTSKPLLERAAIRALTVDNWEDVLTHRPPDKYDRSVLKNTIRDLLKAAEKSRPQVMNIPFSQMDLVKLGSDHKALPWKSQDLVARATLFKSHLADVSNIKKEKVLSWWYDAKGLAKILGPVTPEEFLGSFDFILTTYAPTDFYEVFDLAKGGLDDEEVQSFLVFPYFDKDEAKKRLRTRSQRITNLMKKKDKIHNNKPSVNFDEEEVNLKKKKKKKRGAGRSNKKSAAFTKQMGFVA